MSMQRRLGHSNLEVSSVGLGCYAIGGHFRVENGTPWGWTDVDDEQSVRAIHTAMDMGINFLDTAQAYGCGHSEAVIGRAIAGRRDKVILATKFGKLIDERNKQVLGSSTAPNDIRASCEDSLRRFGTDYIDLFQWHESSGNMEDLPALLETLDELVAAGKIRYYGWSTDDPDRVRQMAVNPNCLAVQHQLHVFVPPDRRNEMLSLCDEFDLASINRSPLMMGILTGKFNADTTFSEGDVRHSIGLNFKDGRLADRLKQVDNMREVLTSEGRTMAQGALAWIMACSSRTIPIPGFKNVQQVVENAGAIAFGPLSEAQMRQIDSILND
ncbi:MAG: aldo/keto reductase [Chloroflexota bacterium]|nr:MAG: aldo/keto reductase [Chloroflexota bacterium]